MGITFKISLQHGSEKNAYRLMLVAGVRRIFDKLNVCSVLLLPLASKLATVLPLRLTATR